MFKNIAFLTVLLACANNALATDFYVSPQGDDDANGLFAQLGATPREGPFRSLLRAQLAIRELKKSDRFKQPVTVHVASGDYILTRTMEFDLRDSGFADRPIRWQADAGNVLLSGGIPLQNCHAHSGQRWRCQTKDLQLDNLKYPDSSRKQGRIPGFELFVNGQRMQLARWPNHDWAHVRQALDQRRRFTAMETLPSIVATANAVQVHIMAGNDWYDQYLGVSSLDNQQNAITLTADTNYPLTSGRRYYLQNIESELDNPGEWFFNAQAGYLDFIPPDDDKARQIIVSALPNLVKISGANYLVFEGMAFAHSTGTAIDIHQARHIELSHLEISNTGGRGIEVGKGSFISLSHSHLHHTGEGGILMNGGDRNSLTPANNLIHNNRIDHFGEVILTYSPAIEISGVGTTARHNLLEYAAGNAIQFLGNDHLLEKNEIHHVCEQASDCGAIYTGRDWTLHGNVVRFNHIHELSGYGLQSVDLTNNRVVYGQGDGLRGIYLDDAASGIAVVGNLLENAGRMSIQLGGGRHNTIRNNLIVTNRGYGIWVDSRGTGFDWAPLHKRLADVPYLGSIWRQHYPPLAIPMQNPIWPENNVLESNIIVGTGNNLAMRYQMPTASNQISKNLLWNPNGALSIDYDLLDKAAAKHSAAPWQEWLAQGVEQESLVADPCLTINNNRVSFCPDSPVRKIAFQALPNDIGLLEKN